MKKIFVLWALLFSPLVNAQFPEKGGKIVLGFPPGGIADTSARIIAQHLSETWGKAWVVENRPGGATVPAITQVAKSPPDGTTLLYANTNIATNPSVYADLPYDAERDLTPVINGVITPGILVVNASSPFQSFQVLVENAKRTPGKITFASVGVASFPHLAMEMLKQMAGVDLLHVPYKGFAPAMTAILANEVDLLVLDSATALGQMKGGKMRALAATGAKRFAVLRELPTVAELGYPEYEAIGWLGMLAPAGTPREIVLKLNAEIGRALTRPEVAVRFAAQGVEAPGGSPEDFGAFIQRHRANWQRVIRAGGIRAEQ